jgi:hypothetical protein
MRQQEEDVHLKEIMRLMLSSPWTYIRTYRRSGGSRLKVDSKIAAAVAQFQANTAILGANGALAVHVSMVHHMGPVHYA